jgi:hypothetical protein
VSRSKQSAIAPAPAPPAVIFRWDLDKTYLRTEFESLRKMVRIPFESAADKVALPGVPQLIQALRRCAGARGERPLVFFLSASPPQIGAAIREKLALDGIEYEGITFKDQLRNLMRGRWRNLREQVGYKLGELLESRLRVPDSPREVLFGDDWESDPLIYSLYADVMNGALAPEQLVEIIARLGVDAAAVERIAVAARRVPEETPGEVARIFINLERRTPPGRFHAFGARLVPAFNYLQTAASLFEMGLLDEGALPVVAGALLEQPRASGERLRNSIDDLVRRGHLRPVTRTRVLRVLEKQGLASFAAHEHVLRARLAAAFDRWTRRFSPTPGAFQIDYDRVLQESAEH